MSKINENDSAMPIQGFAYSAHGYESPIAGLTIRQHFAAMAMQGIIANPKSFENVKEAMVYKNIPIDENATEAVNGFCHLAVSISDALIAELNKNDS